MSIFDCRDMYEQFQTLANVGSLGKMMNMIPGFNNVMGKSEEEDGAKRIKRFMTILDSMSATELDSDSKIFAKQPTRYFTHARVIPVVASHVIPVVALVF
jgi:signal recognition particle subunit SRP54